MSIHFTNKELKRIIECRPIGNFYPFNLEEYQDEAIEDYLTKVVGSFKALKNINYEAEFDHYGSGFASYVDVFCYKRDGSSSEELDGILWLEGIRIYLCRLAPVAVLGKGQMTKHANADGGSSDFLEIDKVGTVPPGNWEEQVKAIKDVLERYQYTILEQDYVNQLLPFDANIPTIFSDPPYRVFDALFYWED